MVVRGRVSHGVVTLENAEAFAEGTEVRVEPIEKDGTGEARESLSAMLLRDAGKGKGLPADLARNHDHYLHGTPQK